MGRMPTADFNKLVYQVAGALAASDERMLSDNEVHRIAETLRSLVDELQQGRGGTPPPGGATTQGPRRNAEPPGDARLSSGTWLARLRQDRAMERLRKDPKLVAQPVQWSGQLRAIFHDPTDPIAECWSFDIDPARFTIRAEEWEGSDPDQRFLIMPAQELFAPWDLVLPHRDLPTLTRRFGLVNRLLAEIGLIKQDPTTRSVGRPGTRMVLDEAEEAIELLVQYQPQIVDQQWDTLRRMYGGDALRRILPEHLTRGR
ncbi:MAG: hypothetical protein ACOCXJ_04225 [Planctomycetota bacterium]